MIRSVVLSIIASYGLQLRPANVLQRLFAQDIRLRSPALARAIIFLAMACLTKSSASLARRAMQVISNATLRTRFVSRSNY
jgi:hypothetical protein